MHVLIDIIEYVATTATAVDDLIKAEDPQGYENMRKLGTEKYPILVSTFSLEQRFDLLTGQTIFVCVASVCLFVVSVFLLSPFFFRAHSSTLSVSVNYFLQTTTSLTESFQTSDHKNGLRPANRQPGFKFRCQNF